MGASFDLSYSVFKEIQVPSKIKRTSFWKFAPNSGHNFATACRSSNVLSTWLEKGGRSERDKLDRRRSTELTIPPNSDARPLVYHSNRQSVEERYQLSSRKVATLTA